MDKLLKLHILNHVLTTRGRIQRNNKALKAMEDSDGAEQNELLPEEKFRDQGFTRPTVLVLLPTRGTCYDFVNEMLAMAGSDGSDEEMKRFEEEYGPIDDSDDIEQDDEKERRRKAVMDQKGRDWKHLFGDSVNKDDDFKIGVSFTPNAAKKKDSVGKRKVSNVAVKMYSDFYKSDIIFASPLALKILTTPEEEGDESDIDFLSSIEICFLGHSDVLLMQNWDHVNDILKLLNQEPQKNNSTDFSRVRNYLLEGQSERWRQIIMSSPILDPALLSTFKRNAKSHSGFIKTKSQIVPGEASISNIYLPVKQVFQRIQTASFEQQSDSRVSYFVKTVLPHILQQKQKHTLIYIPSYFDFCSIRNILIKREIEFVSVTEYSRTSEVSRGRARFLQGRKPLLLYTGRCHFFHRHAIKGIRHLVFVGLPEHPDFYSDHVNAIQKSLGEDGEVADKPSCLALFTKYDSHALERIVGTKNAKQILKSQKSTFMFYS